MEIKKPEMFKMAAEGGKAKLWEQILMFIVVFLIATVIESIPGTISMTTDMMEAMNNGATYEEIQNMTIETPDFLALSLYSTILASAVVILFARFKDKRSLRSIGFERKGAIKHYLAGIFIGFAMFGLVIAINLLTGAMTIESLINNLDGATLGLIEIFFVGFLTKVQKKRFL